MPDKSIHESVRRLILEKIASVWQLEILLELYAQRPRSIGVNELARTIRLEPKPLLGQLHELQNKNLATLQTEGLPTAAYKGGSPEQDQAISLLAEAFRVRPMSVIRLVYSRSDEKMRTLADAFRLKNEKEEPSDD